MIEPAVSPVPTDDGTVSRRDLILLGGTLGFSLFFYYFLTDRVAGLFADDAWYALLAKSIATGQGYQVINSPTPGILPLYPPLYPLLLSIPFRFFREFPENVTALKSISLIAMIGLGVSSFLYFRKYREIKVNLTLIIVTLTLLCQPLMFLATSSLMSECVFAFEMMTLYLVAERLVRGGGAGRQGFDWINVLLLAALVASIYLTRSIGLVLVVAVLIDLVWKRLFRELALVILISGLVVGAWTLHTSSRVPTPEQRLEQGGNIIMNYREAFWQRVAGVDSGKPVTWRELPERVWQNTKTVIDTGALNICAPVLLRGLQTLKSSEPELAAILKILISVVLILLIVCGYICTVRSGVTAAELGVLLMFGVIIIWPFQPLRFLAPMAPFIYFYLFQGVRYVSRLTDRIRKIQTDGRAPTMVVAFVILMISLTGQGWTMFNRQGASLMSFSWEAAFEDNVRLMSWVSANIPKSEVVISNNPALLTLFTGHKSVNLELTQQRWEMFRRGGYRYVVLHRFDGNNVTLPGNNRVLYRIRNEANFEVIDLGPPAARPAFAP